MPLIIPNEHEVKAHIRRFAGLQTSLEMADECNCSISTIRKYAFEMGLSLKLTQQLEEIEIIRKKLKEYNGKKTAVQLSRLLDIPAHRIRNQAKRNGLPLLVAKSHRKQKEVVGDGLFNCMEKDWFI